MSTHVRVYHWDSRPPHTNTSPNNTSVSTTFLSAAASHEGQVTVMVEASSVLGRGRRSMFHVPLAAALAVLVSAPPAPLTTTVTVPVADPHSRAGTSRCSTMCEPSARWTSPAATEGGGRWSGAFALWRRLWVRCAAATRASVGIPVPARKRRAVSADCRQVEHAPSVGGRPALVSVHERLALGPLEALRKADFPLHRCGRQGLSANCDITVGVADDLPRSVSGCSKTTQ